MKRLRSLLAGILLLAGTAGSALAHLDGILPLVSDDTAAVTQARAAGRHVLLYFGDHAN